MNTQKGINVKKLLFSLAVLIVAALMVVGLSSLSSVQAQAKKEAPKTAAAAEPVKGGNIRIVTSVISPKDIGYIPEWGPADFIAALPWAERLVHWDEKGSFVPNLLESWKIDPKAKTITFHIIFNI